MTADPFRSTLASRLHQLIDDFMGRDHSPEQLRQIGQLVEQLASAVSEGASVSTDERLRRFVEQILEGGADGIGRAEFEPFAASPYTGRENPLAPHTTSRIEGDSIVATVRVGLALEGAPGRAHGGAVAAIFDDLMGAVQQINGRTAVTRTLTVDYLAPFPADREVVITAREVESDHRTFTVEADAAVASTTVARAWATFFCIDPSGFEHAPSDRSVEPER